ncbi:MAG TPA: ABC transporter permease [Bacteroidia bacterium]|nr:ABC transporter permease [Bacteroidia bacterium]HNT80922.1 ABC transporter permease [Bacteroidia bacterium]
MNLAFHIAKTHLLTRKKQTLIAMLGVTFGIGMFISLVSLMTGLNKFSEDISMSSSPHIRMYKELKAGEKQVIDEVFKNQINIVHHVKPKDEVLRIRNAAEITEQLNKDDRVAAVSPLVVSQVFFNYGPIQLQGLVSGVNIFEEDKLFDISAKIKSGSLEDLSIHKDGILLGTGLAKKLSAAVGDRVQITTPKGDVLSLKVVGTFQMGIGTIDNVRSYANINTVQNILQVSHSFITDINIRLKDINKAASIAKEYAAVYGNTCEDWETANATFQTGNTVRNIITYAVSITLLIVAGFGIYNILTMSIYNKMKDIAILKAIGFNATDIRNVFLLQSIIIGFFGSIAGLLLGFILSSLIAQAPFDAGEFFSITHFPVNFDPLYYIIGIVFGIATTSLAGLMPSFKAGKMDPVEIIRGQ